MQLIGTKGAVRILADVYPNVFALKPGDWDTAGKADEWRRLEGDPTLTLSAAERSEPACSGRAAMKSLEMIMAVFQAGITRERVTMPMPHRQHPLAT